MVKAKFTNLMLEKLKKLKGNKFLRYLTDDTNEGNGSYCKVGIETDGGNLDIYNEEKPVDWFNIEGEKTKEDISIFLCKERKKDEEFIPYVSGVSIIKHEINEHINSIKIVSDFIKINKEEYFIDYDVAVIIKTDFHEYMFSRGWFFSEEIYVLVDGDINKFYSVDNVTNDWNNGGDYSVDVQRTMKEI